MSKDDARPPAVVFDRVSFAFDDHKVLNDVSFVVPDGSMKVLLGASGALQDRSIRCGLLFTADGIIRWVGP